MDTPTNPNQPQATFAETGELKPPQIEWIQNTPASTTHLPCPGSSWLESVSYDSSSLRLTVTTKAGAQFQHAMVYPNQFAEMQLQNSIGSYYAKNIKGKHPIVHIKKIAKLDSFPERKGTHAQKPKDRFNSPASAHFNRYNSKGRYE